MLAAHFRALLHEKIGRSVPTEVSLKLHLLISDEAQKDLRKRGVVLAAKKSARTAAEGLLAVAQDDKRAAVIELNCETDFVARNEVFQYLVCFTSGRFCFWFIHLAPEYMMAVMFMQIVLTILMQSLWNLLYTSCLWSITWFQFGLPTMIYIYTKEQSHQFLIY